MYSLRKKKVRDILYLNDYRRRAESSPNASTPQFIRKRFVVHPQTVNNGNNSYAHDNNNNYGNGSKMKHFNV